MSLTGLQVHSAGLLAHAWGKEKTTVNRVVKRVLKRKNLSTPSKRKDSGKTIFNCNKKRAQFFTAFNNFKKRKKVSQQQTWDEHLTAIKIDFDRA